MRQILFVASFAVAFMLAVHAVYAQAVQSCICTSGCTVVSDPYPPGADQPTSCSGKVNGVAIAASPVVLSSTIPATNTTVCAPGSPTYSPGVAGSVACSISIPAQAAGTTVIVTAAAINGALPGGTGDAVALTFQSVQALPVAPKVPLNLRVR